MRITLLEQYYLSRLTSPRLQAEEKQHRGQAAIEIKAQAYGCFFVPLRLAEVVPLARSTEDHCRLADGLRALADQFVGERQEEVVCGLGEYDFRIRLYAQDAPPPPARTNPYSASSLIKGGQLRRRRDCGVNEKPLAA